jgi:hypothetical protein
MADEDEEEVEVEEDSTVNKFKLVRIRRTRTSDQGTEGILLAPGFSCYTLELPWRENKSNISCIPIGQYNCEIRKSPRMGNKYWVKKVPKREYILIHSGNYAGDVNKGFKSHVNGCILLGLEMGFISGQRAILNSVIAGRRFMEAMDFDPFILRVTGGVAV